MDKVKGYFKEKKIDAKFATAGRGQKLGGGNNNQTKHKSSTAKTNDNDQKLSSNKEKNGEVSNIPQSLNSSQDKKIYFRCPHLDPDLLLPRDEMIDKVREFLYTNLSSDPIYFSVLIIKTLNSPNVSQNAISILLKYLENLKQDPSNPTFRRIRCQNKIFCQRVKEVDGTIEFLNAIGFVPQFVVEQESTSNKNLEDLDKGGSLNVGEEYLCIPESFDDSNLSKQKLDTTIDILNKAKGLELKLDRDVRLYQYKTSMPKLEPPDNFFQQSLEEIKAFCAATRAKLELESQLRTKAMREADDLKLKGGVDNRENAPYTFVRIKFPQNVVLQGTFEAEEPFTSVIKFVQDYCNPGKSTSSNSLKPGFNLITSWGQKLILDEQPGATTTNGRNCPPSKSKTAANTIHSTLRQLKLVPTALLIFHPNESPGGGQGVAAVAKATYDTYLNERALTNLKIV